MAAPFPPRLVALAAFVGVAIVLLYRAPAAWLARAWLGNEQYTHGFLLLAVALFLLFRAFRARSLRAPASRTAAPGAAGLLLVGVAVAAYAGGFLWRSTPLQLASLPLLGLGLLAILHSIEAARSAAFPALLPLAAVPFPGYEAVSRVLQEWSAELASVLVDAFGWGAEASGVTIASGGFVFDVEPLCSGMSGFLSLVALALVLGHVLDLSPRARLGMVALVFPLALALNATRIAATVALARETSPETALGFFHTGSGIALFLAGLAVLLVVGRRFAPEPEVRA